MENKETSFVISAIIAFVILAVFVGFQICRGNATVSFILLAISTGIALLVITILHYLQNVSKSR